MSQYTESAVKTYPASGALGQYLRVVKDGSGRLVLASNTQRALGVTERPAFAIDDDTPVRIRSAQGTRIMIAAGAINPGAEVFAAANGQVAATGTVSEGHYEGPVAAAAGDFIEVLPV